MIRHKDYRAYGDCLKGCEHCQNVCLLAMLFRQLGLESHLLRHIALPATIAANQDGLLCNLTSFDAFTAIDVPSNYISVPATYLNTQYGGFPTMPDISATYDIPEGRVLVEARSFRDVYGLHWIVYIAILESDVTGAIEASKKKGIITSCDDRAGHVGHGRCVEFRGDSAVVAVDGMSRRKYQR
ncbi:hypothetical protein HDU87_008759 [Geranomyces variabilis]|uniref:Uncharacterized protein n=1 Tax=Geranomyces variabilis TaxID=109894 RepID=A0AAD5TCB9_9FUNG|nr:hypothetical protein HDU87_008759 [Geranomyces variabilis]